MAHAGQVEFAQGVELGGQELQAFLPGSEDGLDLALAVAIGVLGEFALLVGKRQQRAVDLANQACPLRHLGTRGLGFQTDATPQGDGFLFLSLLASDGFLDRPFVLVSEG